MEATTTSMTFSSDAMERVVGALLDGEPVPHDAHARLTDEERAELAGLVATASLTRTVLQATAPPPQAEEASFRRIQDSVRAQSHAAAPPAPPDATGHSGWLSRWWRRQNSGGGQ